MEQIIVKAYKAPEEDDPENWNVQIHGINTEEAKEWAKSSMWGKDWTIRWTFPTDDPPCFLLAKRSSEDAARALAESTATRIGSDNSMHCKGLANTTKAPGKEHVFTLLTAKR